MAILVISQHPDELEWDRLNLALVLTAVDNQWHPQVEANVDVYAVSASDHQSGLTGAHFTV